MLMLLYLKVGGAIPSLAKTSLDRINESEGYGKFSSGPTGSAMFGATFNLVTRVGLP